uniref:Ig-like domain-containing protein n=1 Tax=Catagonus wagneri TaxID=51154 RepID=A0A8C3X5W8_9CETA
VEQPHFRFPASEGPHPVLSVLRAPCSPPAAQPGPRGADAMAPRLTALLCLGTLPKPTLWAEPGPVVTWGSPVTMWCQGTLGAQEFSLDKEGSPDQWYRRSSVEARDKAKFSIPHMTQDYAGRYRCYYTNHAAFSEPSDILELVVTGAYGKPALADLPSPVVASGGNVTLRCGSWQGYNRFILTKDGEHKSSWILDTQGPPFGQTQALFPVGPVTSSHGGTFRCYGCYRHTPQVWSHPSDPLELQVSGEEPAGQAGTRLCTGPAGGAPGGGMLGPGGRVPREGGTDRQGRGPAEPQFRTGGAGSPSPPCSLGRLPVTPFLSLGRLPVTPFLSLGQLPVTPFLSLGQFPVTPSLSVQPGPSVASGQNVTLLCRSWRPMDTFLLSKEGAAHAPPRLRSKPQAGQHQALFSVSPVTSAHGGTYRCYGSRDSDPYLLSFPSDPLELVVSGEGTLTLSSAQSAQDPVP